MATDVIVARARSARTQQSKGASRLSRYRGATALASGLLAMVVLATPAAAQTVNTRGGISGGGFSNLNPSPGGTSVNTGAGGNGGNATVAFAGGGGGGAGETGGNGGAGASNSGTLTAGGGAGGATNGAGGGAGTDSSVSGGGGGGGGAHGRVLATTTNGTGGNGGRGGDSSVGDGGGGGAGGYGFVFTGSGGPFTFGNTIHGGNGGRGGNANGGGFGGSGGDGGHGLVFTQATTATINAIVDGGQGGAAGGFAGCCASGSAGAGGFGIVGSNLNLTLNSAVLGGLSGDTTSRASALYFISGANQVTFGSGALLSGGITNAAGILTLNTPTDFFNGQVISGGGSIVKTGAGTLTLTGDNTYAGTTTISAGTLQIGNGDADGALGGGDIINNATLAFNLEDTFGTGIQFIVGNQISGTGSLVQLGLGTLILTGANTYAGGTTVSAGLINFANGGNLGTGNITLNGGGLQWATGNVLDISNRLNAIGAGGGTFDTNGNDVTLAGVLSGGALTKAGAGTLALFGDNADLGGIVLSGGTLRLGHGNAGGGADASITTLGSVISYADGVDFLSAINLNSDDTQLEVLGTDTATQSGAISETGGARPIEKIGTGTLILTGANTYTGTTTISAGTLQIGSGGMTGTLGGGDVSVASGATLVFNRSDAYTVGNTITGDGLLRVIGTGMLTLSGNNNLTGGIELTGLLRLGSDNAAGGVGNLITTLGSVISYADGIDNATSILLASDTTQLEVLGTDIAAQSGTIGEDQPGRGFEKIGTGTLVLASPNAYSGTTLVSAGTLGVADDLAAGTGRIVLADGTTLLNAGCSCLSLANNIEVTLGGAATIDSGGADMLLSGVISGGDLTFTDSLFGLGLITLTGNNEYGATNIAGGALQIGDGGTSGTLGLGDVTIGLNSGLGFDRSDDIIVGNAISGDGFLAQAGSGVLTLTGSNSYTGGTLIVNGLINFASGDNLGTGSITLAAGGGLQWATGNTLDISNRLSSIVFAGTFDTNGNDVTFLTGLTGSTGIDHILKTGEGTLTLAADNSYGGSTTVIGGALRVGDGGTAGTLGGGDINVFGSTLVFDRTDAVTYANDLYLYGTLVQAGAGSVTLQSVVEVQGAIQLDDGLLNLENAITFQEGSLLTFNGGSLRSAVSQFWDGFLALNWNAQDTSTLSVASGETLTIYSPLSIGNGVNGNPTLRFGTTSDIGTIILNSAALFTGDGTGALIVQGGRLTSQFGDVLNVLASGVGSVQIDAAGTLDLSNAGDFTDEQAIRNLIGQGGLVLGGVTNVLQGDYSGIISGTGSLAMLGGGTLRLAGFNTYSGSTSVLGGTLEFSGGGLFGTSLIELGNGATIRSLTNNLLGGFFVNPRLSILAGGGTIDTQGFALDVLGSVDFGGLLTKTGSGLLTLNDAQNNSTGAGGIDVLAGTLALVRDGSAGTGIISLADGTTLANAACFCGLTLANDIVVAPNGTATLDAQQRATTLNGVLSGGNINFISNTGQSSEGGSAVFTLNGANTYGDTFVGPNVQLITRDGTLGSGDTVLAAALAGPGQTPGTLVFGNTADYSYGGVITGAGAIQVQTVDPSTVITLSGSNTSGSGFTGTVQVDSGRLDLNGDLGDPDALTASMTVNGGTLGGGGTFFGDVVFSTGTLAVGNSPGTLNIAGNLTLGAGTVLNYEFGQPGVVGNNVNDFVTVGGNLTLDGTLNIIDFGPSYGPGYYTLFRYGGTLTDNTLNIGSVDGGFSASVLLNIPGRINLLLGPQVIQYWDGTDTTGVAVGSGTAEGNGGAGTWNATNTNWTAATGFGVNDQWRSTVGIFATVGGTVTVDGAHDFQELRFGANGYVLSPADSTARLTTTGGFSMIDVNTGITTDIGVIIQGAAGLTKVGAGTLILSANNTYFGATSVATGTLRLGVDDTLSGLTTVDVGAGANFDLNGFVQQIAALSGAGNIALGTGGQLSFGSNGASTSFDGLVTGEGAFRKTGPGTFTLNGTVNLTTGGSSLVSVSGGSFIVTGAASITADLVQNFVTLTNSGTINSLTQNFSDLTNHGTINGTTLNFGTFLNTGFMGALSNNGGTATNSGTIDGFVNNFTNLISTGVINGQLNNFGTVMLEGQLNNGLANVISGATVTLTGTTTGITHYSSTGGATLDLASFDTAIGGLSGSGGSILLGSALLTVGGSNTSDIFDGAIDGTGRLTKVGTGQLVLGGANTYTGLTTVSGGVLSISSGGSLAGDVRNDAQFFNLGTIAGFVTNSGILSNEGTFDGAARNLSGGTFTTTGIINPLISGLALTNDVGGTVEARGQINGLIQNSGTFNLIGTLTGVTRFNQFGAAQLNLQGNDFAVGGLGGSGTVDLGSATLTVGVGNLNSTFGGVISGTGGLTKVGTDIFTLSGQNSYTGTTTVSAGTLRVAGSGLIAGDVVNNALLENFATIDGLVSNNDTYTQVGTLNGGLTNNGPASIRGVLNGPVDNHTGSIVLTGTLTGIAAFNQSAGAFFNLNNFDATIGSLAGAGSVQLGTANLTVGGNDLSTSFAGVISGTGATGLTKVGAGTLTLSGTNTYTGTTNVNAGTLTIASTGTVAGNVLNNATFNNDGRVDLVVTNNGIATNNGLIAGGVVNNGAFNSIGRIDVSFVNNAGATAFVDGQLNGDVDNRGTFNAGPLTGITSFVQSATGIFNLTTASLAVGGLSGDGTVNLASHVLTVGSSNADTTFDGVINGSGGLTKIGTGYLTLGGANTYTGLTRVEAGAVIVTGSLNGPIDNFANVLIDGDVRGLVTNFAGGGLGITRLGHVFGDVINRGLMDTAGDIEGRFLNTGTALLRGGDLRGPIDNFGGSITVVFFNIRPVGRLTQTAGSLFDLNSFNVSLGSLAGEGEVRLGNAHLTVGTDNSDSDFAGIITGSGSFIKRGTGTLTLSGSNTSTGDTIGGGGTLTVTSTGRIAGNVQTFGTFNNDGRVDLVVDNRGTGSNSGLIAGGLINTGIFRNTGTIEVGVQNLFRGSFYAQGQINGFIDNRNAFDVTGPLTGITTFLQSSSGQTNLNGWTMTVGALQGSGGINLGNGNGTLIAGDASNATFSGRITGTGNLTKVGSGTLTLAGANTFTGLTTVSAGQLNVAAGGSLASALLNNSLMENRGAIGGLVTNNGIMFSYGTLGGGLVNNLGAQFNNDTLAIITGAVRNDGRLDNFGTINGIVTNSGQLLSARAINGGLVNSGVVLLGGALNGTLTNNAGTVTLGGTTTGITAFTQLAGATFDLAGFNTAIGSMAGAGSVRLGGATLTVGGDNTSTAFAGIISGTGASGLTKVGTGTLTLSGANTYTGVTRINAGTLSVASTGSIGLVLNFANFLNGGTVGAVDNRLGATFTNSGTVTGGVDNAGTMGSTGIINTGLLNSGTAQLRGQLNGFVNNTAGTITLTGALTGITTFTQSAGATLNLNGFSLSIGTLSGAGSILFGGTAAPASAGASASAGDLGAAVFARAPAPEDSAASAAVAAAPSWLVPQESPAPAQVAVAATGDQAAPAPTAGSAPTWLVPQNGTGGRANGFGLIVTDSAMAAPGAGLVAVESPMGLRPDGGALGGNGDTVLIAGVSGRPSASGSETAGPLVASLAGGNGDVVTVAPAAVSSAAVAADAGTLTPAALPPATGPILTVGAGNLDSTFSGVISGNGRLVKVGTGRLILTGANTYTDGTLISGGILQLGDGGTSGSIIGRIENNAVLIVNRSDALTLSGIIDGTGLFAQTGTGTTTLTGANAYTGGTLVSAGRLRGDSVSLQGLIQNEATLEFAQTTAGTFAGRIAGAGAVEKTGAGLLTYTGNNTFQTGQTRILGGELRVNNLLNRSTVIVGNGGTLSGTSIVGGITAQSGGTVAPGAGGIGTLGVNGNIQFLAGSTFAVQVQPAGSDLLLGNGTAQLAGTIAVAGTPGVYAFNSVYVVLQADLGRTGTFGTETGLNTFGQAYAPRIVYTPTQVQLLMAPASLVGIAGPDGTPNQRSTLQRIDAAVAAGYNPQPLIALYNLTPRAAFLNGADQLSGEIYATATRVALDDDRLVREATISRLRLAQDAGFGEGFGAWGHAVASWGSGDSDGNAGRYQRDQQGFVVGVDGGGATGGGSWRLGLLGHHVTTDITVDSRASNADVERTGLGAYAGLEFGGTRVRVGGTYSWLNLDARRVAAFTAFTETLAGETEGQALQLFGEIGHRFQTGASTWLEPFAQASYSRIEFDAFNETGGASSVRVAAEEDDLTMLAFGLRGQALWQIGGNTRLRLDGSLGGRFLSGDRMIFSLISLNASPNQAFDIRSAAMDRFSVLGNLDATFEFGRSVSLSIGYSGVVGANARDHAVRATLGIRF